MISALWNKSMKSSIWSQVNIFTFNQPNHKNKKALCSSTISLGFDQESLFLSWKTTFDVANTAMGNVSEKKEKRQERRNKEGKKKEVLIHSCRCVTLLLPQQKFTTELMTKGRAPCSLLWPGEQYGGCEWLIPLGRWQVGPLSNTRTHFSTGLGRRLTGMGKSRIVTATEPSPRAQTGSHCAGKILSPLSGCGCLCNVRRWTQGEYGTGGGLEQRRYQFRLCESYWVGLRAIQSETSSPNKFHWPH